MRHEQACSFEIEKQKFILDSLRFEYSESLRLWWGALIFLASTALIVVREIPNWSWKLLAELLFISLILKFDLIFQKRMDPILAQIELVTKRLVLLYKNNS